MKYYVTTYNVHIDDSAFIKGRYFDECLDEIEEKDGDKTVVFENRSRFSLKMEWAVHNFLYKIHYKREQTKDVDLDDPSDHPEWIYEILGCLVWIFIR